MAKSQMLTRLPVFGACCLILSIGLAETAPTPAVGVEQCSDFQSQTTGCSSVGGSVNGDGVDLTGSVTNPGTGTATGIGGGVGAGRGSTGGVYVTPPPPPLRDGYTVTPTTPATTPPVTIVDLENFKPSAGVSNMEPNGWMVVGLDTNFYATVQSSVRTGMLLGQPASVRFSPVRYHWTYGDGSAASSSMRGGTWASTGTAEFDPTPTSHVFRAAGRYTIDLSIDYSAEYQFAGGGWAAVAGSVPMPANRLVASAGDANTVLVARNCQQDPSGPGC